MNLPSLAAALALAATAAIWRPAPAATLVVLNKAEASASLIDVATGTEVARVPTGNGPHEVAVSPDGRRAVVTDYGTREAPGNTLTVVDLTAAKPAQTLRLGKFTRPHGICFFADGKRVAVTAEAQQALLVVDIDRGEVLTSAVTEQETSHMVVLTPDAKRAFVANIGSGSVTAIDLAEGKRLANIPTGAGAEGIDITPDGKHVWVTNRAADTVTVLDAAALTVVKTLPCASFPIRVKVSPDGRWVLVSCARSGEVAVFDAKEMKEARRVQLHLEAAGTEGRLFGDTFGSSSVPIGILIEPGSHRAYIAHTNADAVSIIDLRTWEVAAGKLHGGKEPDGLGWSPLDVAAEARKVAPGAENPR